MPVFRPLILIPSYNTGPILCETVAGALSSGRTVWLVIDGSTDGSQELLKDFEKQDLRVFILTKNSGKGAAIYHGLRQAVDEGFTHVLTMDADGQHPASHISGFLRLAAAHPEAVILGKPVFDESAPALRVNGRRLSNFWAGLETLWWGIGDSLFGMRLYPAGKLLTAMKSTPFARRFDFEPEIAVLLCWLGTPVINLPTPVRYLTREEGGVSQFRYLRDNLLLTSMHIRLLVVFIILLPYLLVRGRNPLRNLQTAIQ